MVDVFVSYASQDRETVRPIVEAIKALGWTVWWDRQINAGSAFDREIEKAIDDAGCIVVIWSEASIDSEWVRTEANEGLEKKLLVPVSIEPVRPPLAFRRIQTIDMASLDNISELAEAISRFVAIKAGADSDQTPYIGREKELALLNTRVAQVEREEGAFSLLSGEAGVGKSRLAQEVIREANHRGYLVLTGHCLDMDGALPYQPLIEQIEQATRLVDKEVMRATLGDNAPEVSKLMPELRQQFQDIPDPVSLPPEQERRYLLHGVGEFIDRGAVGQPMVLLFEDLHWADESTCILLRYLAERLKKSRVLMLGTYRESELGTERPFSRALQELHRERLIDEINLRCLDRELVAGMLSNMAKQKPPPELVSLVYSETEGNPFFVEELYRHLDESGKMFTESGEFADGIAIADTEVPRGVRLILGERLERVSKDCRTALTLGAVIGRQFNFEVLLGAAGKMDEDDLLDAMDQALAEKLVTDMSHGREATYGFTQEQVRQTLLSALSFPRRQRMHLRVAESLESYASEQTSKYAGEIAHHLYQAGGAADAEKTIAFLLLAAERALSAIAFEDALRHFDSARSILPEGRVDEVARIDSRRATALKGRGEFGEALDTLQSAIRSVAPGDLQDELILERCRMLLDIWRGSEAVEDLEQLLARRQQGDDREKQLEAQQWVSRAYYVMSLDKGDYAQKAIQAYEDTIALARELNNRVELGRALVAATQLIDYSPHYLAQARSNLEEAEKLAAEIQDTDLEIEIATARLNVYLAKSESDFGEAVLEKLEIRGDPIRLNAYYFRMMWATYGANRLERCVEVCDAGIELAYRIGTLPVQYPTIKGVALLDLGQFSASWDAFAAEIADADHRFGAALQGLGRMQYELTVGAVDEALARASWVIEESIALSRVWMLRWVADSYAAVASLPGNEERLTQFNEIIAATGFEPGTIGKAWLDLAAGDYQTAVGRIEARLARKDRIIDSRHKLNAQKTLGLAQLKAGDLVAAQAHTEQALAITTANNMLAQHWQLLLQQSLVHRALGNEQEAQQLHTQAESVWQEVCDNIPDAEHRQRYTGLAESLGL
jgi:tetratricopeptide (TPR) repeat protein